MKLHFAAASPYTRKVLILAHETGLIDKIDIEPTSVWQETDKIRKDNPLGKIPALVLDDGTCLYDSPVICAWLDTQHDGPKMIPEGDARWPVELLHALADGMTDAALALRADVMRGRDKEPDFYAERMWETIQTGLDNLEGRVAELEGPVNLGICATAALLGYLDFRFGDRDWRPGRPRLTAWYAEFAKRPSMTNTLPE